jgi:ABC-type transport system involved in cytochrome c biogenesis ATPase subunit
MRVSETARWILDNLQETLGLSQASVIEMILREEARRRGFIIPGSGEDKARLAALETRMNAAVLKGSSK